MVPTVATPVEQLDRVYDAAMSAEGQAFFRQLEEYVRLTQDNRRIGRAEQKLHEELEEAERDFSREDERLVAEMVILRRELVAIEPDADTDASDPYPGPIEPDDHRSAEKWFAWAFTMANFDAVEEDREEKIFQNNEADLSRSRMLGEILNAKLFHYRYPRNPNEKVRTDLDEVAGRCNLLREQQRVAHRRREAAAEKTGRIALVGLQGVVEGMEPKQARTKVEPRGSESELARINQLLRESWAGYVYLRELMRPREFRDDMSDSAKERIGELEVKSKESLERVHYPLRRQLEKTKFIPALISPATKKLASPPLSSLSSPRPSWRSLLADEP
jgi:hypothetical protein